MNILCWLWPLLSGLICGYLGYLLGKSLLKEWKDKYDRLYADLDACKKSRVSLEADLKTAKTSSGSNVGSSNEASLNAKIGTLESNLSSVQSKNIELQNELNELKALGSNSSAEVANNLTPGGSSDEAALRLKIKSLEAELSAANTKNTNLEGKLSSFSEGSSASIESLKSKIQALESDLSSSQKKNLTLEKEVSNLKTSVSSSDETSALQKKIQDLESEVSSKRIKNTALENELELLKKQGATNLTRSALASNEITSFDGSAAKAVLGKKIKQDDLTIVEGIGPKIQELFHNHGVKTWLALSECSIEKCQEVLDSGGSRFRMHNPKTWAKQAGFAAKGQWEELKKWQDELDGGK